MHGGMGELQRQQEAHKARQARINAAAVGNVPKLPRTFYRYPVAPIKAIPFKPHHIEYYWRSMWFGDLVFGEPRNDARYVTIKDVLDATARHFNTSAHVLTSQGRSHPIALQRQIAMYISRQLTRHSTTEIGRRFGGRDHTTALYSIRKIGRLIQRDVVVAGDVLIIRQSLGG